MKTPLANVTNTENIKKKIIIVRNIQVILDCDIAELYGVSTGRLNEQVKRNLDRFPNDFMFQLTENEFQNLISQNAISSWGGRRTLPFVFTEQGISSLSGVLKSSIATDVHIMIMRAFVQMRRFIEMNGDLYQRVQNLEMNQLETNHKIENILNTFNFKQPINQQGIFFDGQMFDAYFFVSELIRTANQSIILIDNFIDENVLIMFTKKKTNVNVLIYTSKISKDMQLDIKKLNAQYPNITLKQYKRSHDRFMIIDHKKIYHIGASLKDLGKKWFAFSILNIDIHDILKRLN